MPEQFQVIDLFAGPGGLAEGFSAFRDADGRYPFNIALSVEKDDAAHQTLLLRTFLRKFGGVFPPQYYRYLNDGGIEPDWAALYPNQWQSAIDDALKLELGSRRAKRVIDQRIAEIKSKHSDECILIGGPPCQAYSLVGRARNKGIKGYTPRADKRHFLYKEYIGILRALRPIAFVMENVKGLLSSKVEGEAIFDRVVKDLKHPTPADEYELIPVLSRINTKREKNSDFVVRAEDCGVPQARHRVIIVGVRKDRFELVDDHSWTNGLIQREGKRATVEDVISNMPKLRSGLSRRDDGLTWTKVAIESAQMLANLNFGLQGAAARGFGKVLKDCERHWVASPTALSRSPSSIGKWGTKCSAELREWIGDPFLKSLPNSDTRGHMREDLCRYLFAATYSKVMGRSPKASDFPKQLAPRHSNWKSGKFQDRFRVQVAGRPATTITSHISKDGHYFIHPDPTQCRSLTVREAARLQTFPDNYLFKGTRTNQYIQVGNAVPPLLACKLASALHAILVRR